LRERDREILRLAVPAFGALVAEPLYVLADTAVVGHIGTDELAGLAVASSILLTGYAVFIFLAYGTTSAVARLIGAGDHREAAHQAVQGMWLALLISIGLVVLGAVFADPLVRALGAEGEVREHALVYFRISLAGIPAVLVTLAGTGYLRGLQNTRTPLVVAVTTATGNLVLELILIVGLGFGIGASALATVLAQTAAAAVYVTGVVRAVRVHDVDLRPDHRSIAALAIVGRDLLVRTAALRAALTLGTAVAARMGTEELGAYEIAFAIWSFLALALDALAIAGQSIIGLQLGAGDADSARAAGRRMIELGILAGAVLALAVVALRPVLPHLFTDDPEVIALTSFTLLHVAALQPINGVVFVLDGVLIGAGDLRFLAWAMVVAFAAFATAAGAVLVLDLGLGWLWAAVGVLMVTRLVTLGTRFRGGRWAVTGARRVRNQ
jgi:putative MATE family efflux protein